jgi:hypothetical protein
MSEIIFILGAGASKHCGTPLMGDFLDVSRNLLKNGEVQAAEGAFSTVMEAIGKLNAVHSKAKLDTYNIESVYTAFEMGKLLGKLPGIDNPEKIDELVSSLKKVIGYTLEKTMKIPIDSRINPFQGYYDFSNILNGLTKKGKSFSVISFNYDLGLEYAIAMNAYYPVSYDYCVNDFKQQNISFPYLKLHGSLNFGRCKKNSCRKITPYQQLQYTETSLRTGSRIIPIMSNLKNLKCKSCGGELEEDPVLVPPTWNKTAHHEMIDQVWRRAAKEMGNAEEIFVLGYSLPETDWFFNYLYGLGADMETQLKGFYVVNPDISVKKRFENLLGSNVTQRFHFYNSSFENAVTGVMPESIPKILDIKY